MSYVCLTSVFLFQIPSSSGEEDQQRTEQIQPIDPPVSGPVTTLARPRQDEEFTSHPQPLAIAGEPQQDQEFTSHPQTLIIKERPRPRHRKRGVTLRERRLTFQRTRSLPSQYYHSALNSDHGYYHTNGYGVNNYNGIVGNSHYYYSSSSPPTEDTLQEEYHNARMRGEESGSPSSLSEVDSALGGSTTSPGSCRKANRLRRKSRVSALGSCMKTRR